MSLLAAGGSSWSYPNLHGDAIVMTDSTGLRLGARATYDPFGQPIEPATGNIGTSTANSSVPDNSPGQADYAYVGAHRKLHEHQGSIATIEMGARQYVREYVAGRKFCRKFPSPRNSFFELGRRRCRILGVWCSCLPGRVGTGDAATAMVASCRGSEIPGSAGMRLCVPRPFLRAVGRDR